MKKDNKEKVVDVDDLKNEETIKIEALQEEIVKEKCDNVELQAEIEKDKSDIKELVKENRSLKRSISFLRFSLFLIFTVVVFTGGWYLGTQLVVLDEYIYGEEREINPPEDKEISFSKEEANLKLKNFYDDFMKGNGLVVLKHYNGVLPDKFDMVNVYEYKLSVVPRIDQKMYNHMLGFTYVEYDKFKEEYEKLYNKSDLDSLFMSFDSYPKLIDDKVVFINSAIFDVDIIFSSEKIKYTASNKLYTMTGKYKEVGKDFLSGIVVNANFELKYKIDDSGNRYIVGMVIDDYEYELERENTNVDD